MCKTYNILEDPKRKSTFSGSALDCDQKSQDSSLATGSWDWKAKNWYRFEEPAGIMIANSSVTKSHCGTSATGWLNGAHPASMGEIVTRTVCFNWAENSCWKSIDVQIKKCDGYFVYELPPTPGCHLKYCGQTEAGRILTPFQLMTY